MDFLRKKITAIAGSLILCLGATSAQAALVQADFTGEITEVLVDLTGTSLAGITEFSVIDGYVRWDDADVTGVGFEDVAYDFLDFDFVNGLTVTPDNTAADPLNTLEFSDGDLIGMFVFAEIPDISIFIEYGSSGAFFDIFDEISGDVMVSGEFGLPPGSITPVAVVPVPAAVWLFGSGLLGIIGIARRGRV